MPDIPERTQREGVGVGKIVLVTGGARSGKSLFAERYAAKYGEIVAYIATAQIYDDEMSSRVERHRQRRPASWRTWEAPYHADQSIHEASMVADIVLFDCLTLYTTNLMLSAEAPQDVEKRFQYVMKETDKLIARAQAGGKTVIFVTNEVGMGIVPDNPMAREYRDLAGSVNQKIAAEAEEVYLVISGIPVEIKNLAATLSEV
jgi:adenosylcobinamide kinase/adenosylcobinamide-phosphate guanylyltransferase